jgi:predicted metal-dependent enzyme (double-stranded beta helix superfamily)
MNRVNLISSGLLNSAHSSKQKTDGKFILLYITFMAYLTILSVALTRGAQSSGASLNFVRWGLIAYLWVRGNELTSHLSEAQGFEVTSRFFKNFTNPSSEYILFSARIICP